MLPLLGPVHTVNSTHHQSVSLLPQGYKVTAYSTEGIIEGIAHESAPFSGVQFHPERLVDEDPAMLALFKWALKLP